LATPLGGIIAFLTLIALSNANKVIDDSAGILAGTLFGISLGLTQWLVLRGKVRNAAWWVLANATIWPVSIFVGAGVTTAINTDPIIVASAATLVGILTTVALAESIRGVVLLWLVYRPTDVGKKPNEIVSSAQ